jgi:hypothetical protein
MSGEELEGQRRELFGAEVGHCDICGASVPLDQLRTVDGLSALADHDHTPVICPDCRGAIRRGEIDAESFLTEIDEEGSRDTEN